MFAMPSQRKNVIKLMTHCLYPGLLFHGTNLRTANNTVFLDFIQSSQCFSSKYCPHPPHVLKIMAQLH